MQKGFWRTLGLGLAGVIVLVGAAAVYAMSHWRFGRINRIGDWFADPSSHRPWQIQGGERCGAAPMLIPSTGFVGVGYGDGAPPFYQHTGYDIFSPDGADNITPIVAAYDGYLTREADWRSAVIIRHPDFAALPEETGGQQIWTYYTHMASADGEQSYISAEFPRGTREKFVKAGTLLGYQGTWSGDPERRMGLHLHFSVVKSDPVTGHYLNETRIANTLDPRPFLGLTETRDGMLICPSS